jgi:probable rRNA maturation factor
MIEINNLTTSSVDEGSLKEIVKKVLTGEGKEEGSLSIALVGPGRMKKINKAYLKRNRTTDVLSFPESEIKFEKFKISPLRESKNLGEIIICLREVKKNAKRCGADFKTELSRVLIHGILHLLGHDHEKSEKETKKMEEKQNHYLSQLLTS